ncbi:MAG: hypothetical protein Q4G35_02405 [Propionibacteriaceae bacterium]|nr:hypothetical protein [Propionibacteriaceae bacterium]
MAFAVLLLALVGCGSSGEPQPTGSGWSAEFEQARADATSDFARAALADDEISESEYQEAQGRFVQCLADAGFPGATFDANGGSSIPDEGYTADQINTARQECDASTDFALLQSLYLGVRMNPSNVNPSVLIADCLVRRGVVDQGYSGSDFERDMEKFVADPDGDPATVFPFVDAEKGVEEFFRCQSDPSTE